MNSRKCDICIVHVNRASFVKHLRSKKHIENEKQNELNIPEWLFKELIEIKLKKIYNPKTLGQKTRENIKLDDKQLKKDLGKKVINSYHFTDRVLQLGFNFTLKSHHKNHVTSNLIIKPNYPEFGIDVRYNNKIIKDLSVFYARLINKYKLKFPTVFSAKVDK